MLIGRMPSASPAEQAVAASRNHLFVASAPRSRHRLGNSYRFLVLLPRVFGHRPQRAFEEVDALSATNWHFRLLSVSCKHSAAIPMRALALPALVSVPTFGTCEWSGEARRSQPGRVGPTWRSPTLDAVASPLALVALSPPDYNDLLERAPSSRFSHSRLVHSLNPHMRTLAASCRVWACDHFPVAWLVTKFVSDL